MQLVIHLPSLVQDSIGFHSPLPRPVISADGRLCHGKYTKQTTIVLLSKGEEKPLAPLRIITRQFILTTSVKGRQKKMAPVHTPLLFTVHIILWYTQY